MTLATSGVTLHVESAGAGPALLCIPGGAGDAGTFQRLAAALAGERTVISYDRRGFSRSPMPPDTLATRFDDDVEDAAHLIAVHGGGRCDVLGSSSGAVVALQLLARHPARVRKVVAHEPPLTALVPDGAAVLAGLTGVVEVFRARGLEAAMRLFGEVSRTGYQAPPPLEALPAPAAALLRRMALNGPFWIEHELLQYVTVDLPLDVLRGLTDQIVLANGVESAGQFPAGPNLALAGLLGVPVTEFPGNHHGYVMDPTAFAARLRDTLR